MKKSYTIFDNCNVNYDALYEEYKEWCEVNETEPKSDSSHDYWNYVNMVGEDDWESLEGNIKYSAIGDKRVVVMGSAYGWRGAREIVPCVVDSLWDAILKICSIDCHIEIKQEFSTIVVRQWSHDDPMGNTIFRIKFLNENGKIAYLEDRDVDLSNRRYHETLKEHIFGWC